MFHGKNRQVSKPPTCNLMPRGTIRETQPLPVATPQVITGLDNFRYSARGNDFATSTISTEELVDTDGSSITTTLF
jgi:hypothetical protein